MSKRIDWTSKRVINVVKNTVNSGNLQMSFEKIAERLGTTKGNVNSVWYGKLRYMDVFFNINARNGKQPSTNKKNAPIRKKKKEGKLIYSEVSNRYESNGVTVIIRREVYI